MSMDSALQTAAGAITQIAYSTSSTAHNIANVNTPGFSPTDMNYQTGPSGMGVEAYATDSYSPEDYMSDAHKLDADLFTANGNYNSTGTKATFEAGSADDRIRQISNEVDVAKEFTDLIANDIALKANAKSFTSNDAMFGSVFSATA